MISANTLYKNILNVKDTVIENRNVYSDVDGVKLTAKPCSLPERGALVRRRKMPLEDLVYSMINCKGLTLKLGRRQRTDHAYL